MGKGPRKYLTNAQIKILKSIISGPKTLYDLTMKEKMHKDTVENFFSRASEAGFIEIKKNKFLKRGKRPYGLTLLGLLFCIRYNHLEPRKAYDVRLKHKLDFPKMKEDFLIPLVLEDGKEIPIPLEYFFIKDIEKNNTEEFYKFLAYLPIFPTEGNVPFLFNMVGFLLLFSAYNRKDKFLEKYIKGDDLLLPCGLTIVAFKNFHHNFKKNIKASGLKDLLR